MAKTLNTQWNETQQKHQRMVILYGPNSLRAKRLERELKDLTNRILRRDNKKVAA